MGHMTFKDPLAGMDVKGPRSKAWRRRHLGLGASKLPPKEFA